MGGLERVRSVVVTGADGIARALCRTLELAGIDARAVAVDALEFPDGPCGLIYLGGLRDDEPLAINREAFAVARAFAPTATTHGGLMVTVQDTGGDFGLAGSERALIGGLAGLAKTADVEWADTNVRAIDLERSRRTPEELADAIAAELLTGGTGIEVGLAADGTRTVLRSRRTPATATSRSPLSKASVVVCSGGARGVTASTMIALAKHHHCAIALLGRTALGDEPTCCAGVEGDAGLKRALLADAKRAGRKITPAELGSDVRRILAVREIRATLAGIEAAGGRARYWSVDVTDSDEVAASLSDVRAAWGPITAIVHGAGVVADKLIADKTDEQFSRVFDTKVRGLTALLAATAGDPLDTLVLFSSVAARSGNTGQCDYAMANEILNKMAASERRRRPNLVVKSLGWGPWEAGMVTPSLKAYFESHGVPLIGLEDGARMLIDELCADRDAIEVVLGAPPTRSGIAGGSSSTTELSVLFSARRQPHLRDHAIDGTPVLPMTMALELCTRAARAVLPERVVTGCRDLKMYRGILLDRFDTGHWLSIKADQQGDDPQGADQVTVRIDDPDGKRHYAAVVELAESSPRAPAFDAPAMELTALQTPIYERLFHGPDFHVLESVDGVGESGIIGRLAKGERDWGLTLDGGMQLAVLWTQHRLGGKALPTGVGAFTAYGTPNGALTCTLVGRSDGAHGTVSDITFVDEDGRIACRLEGVQMLQRP